VIATPHEAFGPDWIGAGGRAYVSRYALDPARAIGLVRASGGAVVLAHPGAISRGWRIPDEAIAALAGAGLAGLEVDHPDHDEAERARLRVLAADLGLVTTGGSDDHGDLTGHRLGVETTSPAAFGKLMALAADGDAAEPGHGQTSRG
jgi:predicted metal-dependent phosphoesterase TrpH